MKVALDYRDGIYTMYDPSVRKFADGVDPDSWMASNTIEISEAEWTAYNSFLVQYGLWQRHLIDLAEQIDVIRHTDRQTAQSLDLTQRATKLVDVKMEDIEWSVRVGNCLRNAEIRTMGELLRRSSSELLRINGFGQRSLREVQAVLHNCGVQLPPYDPEKPLWMPPNQ